MKTLYIWDIDSTITNMLGKVIWKIALKKFSYLLRNKNAEFWFITGRSESRKRDTKIMLNRLMRGRQYKLYMWKTTINISYIEFKMRYIKKGIINFDKIQIYDDNLDILLSSYIAAKNKSKLKIFLATKNQYIEMRNLDDITKRIKKREFTEYI